MDADSRIAFETKNHLGWKVLVKRSSSVETCIRNDIRVSFVSENDIDRDLLADSYDPPAETIMGTRLFSASNQSHFRRAINPQTSVNLTNHRTRIRKNHANHKRATKHCCRTTLGRMASFWAPWSFGTLQTGLGESLFGESIVFFVVGKKRGRMVKAEGTGV